MAAASEPASRLVSPKAGISRPSARRGSQKLFCLSVPNSIKSSPGPSELGTITVTAADGPREAIFMTISELAVAEKPLPPYSSGMMRPRKPSAFDAIPDRLGDVALGKSDLPVVDEAAQLFDGAVDEGPFLVAQAGDRHVQDL